MTQMCFFPFAVDSIIEMYVLASKWRVCDNPELVANISAICDVKSLVKRVLTRICDLRVKMLAYRFRATSPRGSFHQTCEVRATICEMRCFFSLTLWCVSQKKSQSRSTNAPLKTRAQSLREKSVTRQSFEFPCLPLFQSMCVSPHELTNAHNFTEIHYRL